MSDNNKSSSNINPGKPFWRNSDVISNKVSLLPVVNVHQCVCNNSFAVEFLENNDFFLG